MTLDLLFPPEFVTKLIGLVLLIAIDLAFGVSLALKQKRFDLQQLADFYRVKVVPNMVGWIVIDVVLRVAAFYQIPIMDALAPLLSVGFYGIVLAALLAQIVSKGAQIAQTDQPINPPPADPQ
jgi:hypothetical protein